MIAPLTLVSNAAFVLVFLAGIASNSSLLAQCGLNLALGFWLAKTVAK